MTKPGGCFAPAQILAQKMRIWYESPSYERIPKTTSPPTAARSPRKLTRRQARAYTAT